MDSKDLSLYITRNSAGENTDHLVMSKKKPVEPKFRRGMTKMPISSVSTEKFKYLFKFYEKNYNKRLLVSQFKNEIQTAISGLEYTITRNKNTIVHRKLVSNPLPFQQTIAAPTKRINTHKNHADQPSCSKTLDTENCGGIPYKRQERNAPTHKP